MKKTKTNIRMLLCILLGAVVFVAGCADKDRSGGTIDEPEITVEYLTGKYVDQLMTDKAEHIFGAIEITGDETAGYIVNIDAKEFVEDQDQPNGFYIADKNEEFIYALPTEARATYIAEGTSIANVITVPEFVSASQADLAKYGANNPSYQQNKLYNIYVMSDQIVLINARYLP